MRATVVLLLTLISSISTLASAQDLEKRPADQKPSITVAPGKTPNSNATYQQLRNIGLSGETASANNLVLKRDAGVFTFKSGTFQFLAPVNGKVTGAVFLGDGTFSMVPPLEQERRSLSLLSKEPALNENFKSLVLRFTDGTYEEIKKAAGTSTGPPSGSGELDHVRNALRHKLHYNLDARILQDVLSNEPGGLFFSFIHGEKYNGKELFAIDPHGVDAWAPEEVVFLTWDEIGILPSRRNEAGAWASFHYSHEYQDGKASGTQSNNVIAIERQKLDTHIEKKARLDGDAITTIIARKDGVSVLPFNLFHTLRVSNVLDEAGQPLDFVQEDKDDDPDFHVILSKPLKAGEKFVLRTIYSGKEAVTNEGDGNYYPVARSNWFPNTVHGNYANYEMTFRVPKGLTMVATGMQLRSVNEGDQNISEWKTEVPQAVAGFNFGKFKHLEAKGKDFTVESFANENPPDWVRGLQNEVNESLSAHGEIHFSGVALGTMDTTTLMKKPLAEAQLAMAMYSDYFGPSPYRHVAMTQQTACNFGQSWPALVYMPICVFYDATVRHQLGLDDTRGYWNVVGPHEVAHQWWGHAVGWQSYRFNG